jgi:hypothetical protein
MRTSVILAPDIYSTASCLNTVLDVAAQLPRSETRVALLPRAGNADLWWLLTAVFLHV